MVKRYREEICKSGPARCCPTCRQKMVRWGFFWRSDVRLACGTVLVPLKIQRWRCSEHGTCSFLPDFLMRCARYLVEVVARVCDWSSIRRKISFPDEVTGPSEDTGRRWFNTLCSPQVERWLLIRHSPPAELSSYQPARIIELARSYAVRLNFCSNLYPRLLQLARLPAKRQ